MRDFDRSEDVFDEDLAEEESAETGVVPVLVPKVLPPAVSLTPSRPWYWGLGRRKSAVARVRMKPGAGAFLVNGRPYEEYFRTLQSQRRAYAPLEATSAQGNYDILCNVSGGGPAGQADAVRMGIARALKIANPGLEELLRAHGLLTRDSRMKERKKYGRRGARRGFQFSKR